MPRMKAGVLRSAGKISCEEIEMPEIQEGEALVRTRFSGICSSDLKRAMEENGAYHYPLVPGHEFSGQVHGISEGKGKNGLVKGDRVAVFPLIRCGKCEFCKMGRDSLCESYGYLGSRSDGGFAEYVKAPVENLIKIPDNVGLKEASLTEPSAVALHGVKKGHVEKGATCLVYGAGTIGLFTAQWALAFGAGRVILVGRNPHKLEFAKNLCCGIATVNSREDNALGRVSELTGSKGADVVFECAGSVDAQAESILTVKKGGTIAYIGNSRGNLEIAEKDVPKILRKEITIKGSWNSDFLADWPQALQGFSSGKIKGEPLITHTFPLDEIFQVFERLKNREIRNVIKVTFEI